MKSIIKCLEFLDYAQDGAASVHMLGYLLLIYL